MKIDRNIPQSNDPGELVRSFNRIYDYLDKLSKNTTMASSTPSGVPSSSGGGGAAAVSGGSSSTSTTTPDKSATVPPHTHPSPKHGELLGRNEPAQHKAESVEYKAPMTSVELLEVKSALDYIFSKIMGRVIEIPKKVLINERFDVEIYSIDQPFNKKFKLAFENMESFHYADLHVMIHRQKNFDTTAYTITNEMYTNGKLVDLEIFEVYKIDADEFRRLTHLKLRVYPLTVNTCKLHIKEEDFHVS